MAERKATNKYYPPDWDPSKGSVNRHKKSHPLRDRARKIDEGILVVRFEMPYNIWCLGCDNHVAMGVRFNAEKSKVGNYYSSPIYKFRMKCRLCDNHFEIQTDPSKFDYVILRGARKQVRSSDTDETAEYEQVAINDEESRRKMTDAMFRLEKKVEDKINGDAAIPSLHELKQHQSRWKDSFAANQLLRSQYREKRKRIEQNKSQDKNLLSKSSLKISLVKSNPMDRELAKAMLTKSKIDRLSAMEACKREAVFNSKIIPQIKVKAEKTVSSITNYPKPSKATSPSSRVRIKRDPG